MLVRSPASGTDTSCSSQIRASMSKAVARSTPRSSTRSVSAPSVSGGTPSSFATAFRTDVSVASGISAVGGGSAHRVQRTSAATWFHSSLCESDGVPSISISTLTPVSRSFENRERTAPAGTALPDVRIRMRPASRSPRSSRSRCAAASPEKREAVWGSVVRPSTSSARDPEASVGGLRTFACPANVTKPMGGSAGAGPVNARLTLPFACSRRDESLEGQVASMSWDTSSTNTVSPAQARRETRSKRIAKYAPRQRMRLAGWSRFNSLPLLYGLRTSPRLSLHRLLSSGVCVYGSAKAGEAPPVPVAPSCGVGR